MQTVLVADHNVKILSQIEEVLETEGLQVIIVQEAYQIIPTAREYRPDIIILDLEMPNSNGLIMCHELRNLPHLTHVPVLFISSNREDMIRTLDAGGDDFIAKPFAMPELAARVRALLRRFSQKFHVHDLKIDYLQRLAWVDNARVDLTPTEFDLLEYLCQRHDEYHSAGDLLQAVWNYPPGIGDTALVRNHIHNLRCKLESNPNRPQIIVSLHGRGYRIYANIEYAGQDSRMVSSVRS
ncbi:MAG: response regulator transcription factor [Chloroflexi bacterium]|nr:response regulator transcription factor [Chloroflexota bacterium]